jgi:hypothetical protein
MLIGNQGKSVSAIYTSYKEAISPLHNGYDSAGFKNLIVEQLNLGECLRVFRKGYKTNTYYFDLSHSRLLFIVHDLHNLGQTERQIQVTDFISFGSKPDDGERYSSDLRSALAIAKAFTGLDRRLFKFLLATSQLSLPHTIDLPSLERNLTFVNYSATQSQINTKKILFSFSLIELNNYLVEKRILAIENIIRLNSTLFEILKLIIDFLSASFEFSDRKVLCGTIVKLKKMLRQKSGDSDNQVTLDYYLSKQLTAFTKEEISIRYLSCNLSAEKIQDYSSIFETDLKLRCLCEIWSVKPRSNVKSGTSSNCNAKRKFDIEIRDILPAQVQFSLQTDVSNLIENSTNYREPFYCDEH